MAILVPYWAELSSNFLVDEEISENKANTPLKMLSYMVF